jgi:hypothetical protein
MGFSLNPSDNGIPLLCLLVFLLSVSQVMFAFSSQKGGGGGLNTTAESVEFFFHFILAGYEYMQFMTLSLQV